MMASLADLPGPQLPTATGDVVDDSLNTHALPTQSGIKSSGSPDNVKENDDDDDLANIKPAYLYADTVPVFTPTMKQFRSFRRFIEAVDKFGMASGIIKVIPPPEWRADLPDLTDRVGAVKVHRPLVQEFEGSRGVFTQMNMEKNRTYTVADWKRLATSRGHATPEPRRQRLVPKTATARNSAGFRAESADRGEPDYRLAGIDQFTDSRCRDLEESYWRTVTYGTAMYGADMLGSLFDSSTTSWNVAKLENVLDVLGTTVPGVNTAYLYVGMWKATFAWHLEDVDLYSINYIHFGAPKQWYSISQADQARFESAMRTLFPDAARECDQFLRHKTFLVSPDRLQKQFGITVNRLVQREGEFVVTFPYGYHAGYNIGYNCAESVNFATNQWLMSGVGRRAKRCECVTDSVWVDVREIENRLSVHVPGFSSSEQSDLSDPEHDSQLGLDGLAGSTSRPRRPTRPRKPGKAGPGSGPARCVFCPAADPALELATSGPGEPVAHRLCADLLSVFWHYRPETESPTGVAVDAVPTPLRQSTCSFCRSRRGAVVRCGGGDGSCTKLLHPVCVFLSGGNGDVTTEDAHVEGQKWAVRVPRIRCFEHADRHRTCDIEADEPTAESDAFLAALGPGDLVRVRAPSGAVWAGCTVAVRPAELSVLVRPVRPRGLPAGVGEESLDVGFGALVLPRVVADVKAECDPLPAQLWSSFLEKYISKAVPRFDRPSLPLLLPTPARPSGSSSPLPASGLGSLLGSSISGSTTGNSPGTAFVAGSGLVWGELITPKAPVCGRRGVCSPGADGGHLNSGSNETDGTGPAVFWHYLAGTSSDAHDEYAATPGGIADKRAKPRAGGSGPDRASRPTTVGSKSRSATASSMLPPTTGLSSGISIPIPPLPPPMSTRSLPTYPNQVQLQPYPKPVQAVNSSNSAKPYRYRPKPGPVPIEAPSDPRLSNLFPRVSALAAGRGQSLSTSLTGSVESGWNVLVPSVPSSTTMANRPALAQATPVPILPSTTSGRYPVTTALPSATSGSGTGKPLRPLQPATSPASGYNFLPPSYTQHAQLQQTVQYHQNTMPCSAPVDPTPTTTTPVLTSATTTKTTTLIAPSPSPGPSSWSAGMQSSTPGYSLPSPSTSGSSVMSSPHSSWPPVPGFGPSGRSSGSFVAYVPPSMPTPTQATFSSSSPVPNTGYMTAITPTPSHTTPISIVNTCTGPTTHHIGQSGTRQNVGVSRYASLAATAAAAVAASGLEPFTSFDLSAGSNIPIRPAPLAGSVSPINPLSSLPGLVPLTSATPSRPQSLFTSTSSYPSKPDNVGVETECQNKPP